MHLQGRGGTGDGGFFFLRRMMGMVLRNGRKEREGVEAGRRFGHRK